MPTVTLLLLGGSLVCGVAFFVLRLPASCSVSGGLTKFGDITLEYNSSQHTGISPLCGCYAEMEADKWRGITFVARNMTIERKGDLPSTEYIITGAVPEEIKWYDSLYKLEATIFEIAIPIEEVFDPAVLIAGHFPPNYKVSVLADSKAERYINLITTESINVSLLGDVPISAWIPAKESRVSIKYEKGMFPSSSARLSITETYKNWAKRFKDEPSGGETIAKGDYPIGDFLGPNVVFWSSAYDSTIVTESGFTARPSTKQANQQLVRAILVTKPPFSARVACMPVSGSTAENYANEAAAGKAWPWIRHLDTIGQVEVTVMDPERESESFQAIYKKMQEKDTVWIDNIQTTLGPIGDKKHEKIKMEFRYPPIPPKTGLNIFGSMSYLNLTSALGKLMFKDRSLEIPVGGNLEFTGIQGLEVEGRTILVPVKADAGGAAFRMRSASRITVNGVTQNTLGANIGIKTSYEYVILILSAVSAFGVLISIART